MSARQCWCGLVPLVWLYVCSSALAGPLHDAAGRGDVAQVQRLLDQGGDVNAREDQWGVTPLHLAATVAVAQVLLAHGAAVSPKSHGGLTPLHIAAVHGHVAQATHASWPH